MANNDKKKSGLNIEKSDKKIIVKKIIFYLSFFTVIIVILNVAITKKLMEKHLMRETENALKSHDADKNNIEFLEKENKLLKVKIDNLALMLSEKEKLIEYLRKENANSVTFNYRRKTDKTPGVGGKESIKFEQLNVDTVKNELSAVSSNTNLSFSDKKKIYAYTPTIWPCDGYISSKFGYRNSPFSYHEERFHEGVDICAVEGTPIFSAADGIVIYSEPKGSYGNFMLIKHGSDYVTAYAHCSKLLKKTNESVKKGEVVAWVGNTGASRGAHLHYELRINGIPVDPELYLVNKK